jgi:diaminohydroxyphosphoribosylaminopyrimidine deaminase/5-amino-6-(5-phosphoribosylamino)uracil reductase
MSRRDRKSTDEAAGREALMLEALAEAAKGKGATFPNPAVGAVVVRGRRTVGRGFHKRWGLPHAEVVALGDAGTKAKGADLYVTLEPCSHWGKTPPCTDAIIRSGIKRVFVASMDPNPVVKGSGIRTLNRAGIEVVTGLAAEEAVRLNEAYFKFMKTGRPFVTLKVAQTLDGKIATRKGESRWVTSAASRRLAKRLRAEAQVIIVGVNTVRNDDPGLLPIPRRKTYYRCILDTDLSIPPKSQVVKGAARHPTIVYCSDPSGRKAARLEKEGVWVRGVPTAADGMLDVTRVIDDLSCLGIMHVFIEGGSVVFGSFLKAGLVDKLLAFVAPKVLGDVNGIGAFSKLDVTDLAGCYAFRLEEVRSVGADALLTLYPRKRGGRPGQRPVRRRTPRK